jgi:hypothetical protein
MLVRRDMIRRRERTQKRASSETFGFEMFRASAEEEPAQSGGEEE